MLFYLFRRGYYWGFATACLFALLPTLVQAQERTIVADMSKVTGPRDMAWQDCVGAGHAGLLLRPENQTQLRLVHDEIGFKYIRFHGIFADDTDAYREVDGKPAYDFSKTDAVYAAVIKAGMKPFVEVSFMPHDLASGTKTIFYWKANGSPPKDWGKWSDFIKVFTQHLEARFGVAEVRSWRFEIWNEPNLDGFWTDGNQANYFQLYDTTVKAIIAVDPALKVGGPATAGAAWAPEFLAHAKSAGVPVDFVTTHTYGVSGGFLDEKGEGDNKLVVDPGSISNDVWKVREQIQADWPGLPLYFTEWSTSYNSRDPVHDDYLSAAFILDKLKKTEGGAQSMSYWTYTDLFEEAGPPPSSFHGGFGLVNREGVRKAAFFAYKYLDELGPQGLRGGDARSYLTRTKNGFAGLFWDYTMPDQQESDRPFFRKLRPATPVAPVELKVTKLKPGSYRLLVYRTGFEANDAYSKYIEWGMPKDLSAEQINLLKGDTSDAPEINSKVKIGSDGVFQRTIKLRSNDVILVKLVTNAKGSGRSGRPNGHGRTKNHIGIPR
jgi:xylan 1,4-beta-xylosidase